MLCQGVDTMRMLPGKPVSKAHLYTRHSRLTDHMAWWHSTAHHKDHKYTTEMLLFFLRCFIFFECTFEALSVCLWIRQELVYKLNIVYVWHHVSDSLQGITRMMCVWHAWVKSMHSQSLRGWLRSLGKMYCSQALVPIGSFPEGWESSICNSLLRSHAAAGLETSRALSTDSGDPILDLEAHSVNFNFFNFFQIQTRPHAVCTWIRIWMQTGAFFFLVCRIWGTAWDCNLCCGQIKLDWYWHSINAMTQCLVPILGNQVTFIT